MTDKAATSATDTAANSPAGADSNFPPTPPSGGSPDLPLVRELLKLIRAEAGKFGGIVALTAIVVVATVMMFVSAWAGPARLFTGGAIMICVLLFTALLVNTSHLILDPRPNDAAQRLAFRRLIGLLLLLVSASAIWAIASWGFGSPLRDKLAAISIIQSDTLHAAAASVRDNILGGHEEPHCRINTEEDLDKFGVGFSGQFLTDVSDGIKQRLDRPTLLGLTKCERTTIGSLLEVGDGPHRHDIVISGKDVHFTDRGIIRIGSRKLYIIANRLTAEPGARIEAFYPDNRKSKLSTARDAGHVRIILLERPTHPAQDLVIDLRGEDGLDGARGEDATPARQTWRPQNRPYEQRRTALFASTPSGIPGVDECSDDANKRRMEIANRLAQKSDVFEGPMTDDIAEVRRLMACAEKSPNATGKQTARSPNEIRSEFREIETLLAQKAVRKICLFSFVEGTSGRDGQLHETINGRDGRSGGRGGTLRTAYPSASGAPWISAITVGGEGGVGGGAGRPQAGGDGEPEIAPASASPYFGCPTAPAGADGNPAKPGAVGKNGDKGLEGRNDSVALPRLR